jgi:hypothetical protein
MLFPDVTRRAADKIRDEIGESNEIRTMQLLPQAAADEHGEISKTANVYLINLGKTATTGLDSLVEALLLVTTAVRIDADNAGSDDTAGPEKTFFEKEMEKLTPLSGRKFKVHYIAAYT